ncbi:MAG: zf-TFIIB domain-containing protein [Verrucomicrobiae bacterium]|nr:zf-TFIIB domain-containing protein [Verrucomicrobiae bacterium]
MIFARTDQLTCPRCHDHTLVPGSSHGFDAYQCQTCKGAFVHGTTISWVDYQAPSKFAETVGDGAVNALVEVVIEGVLSIFNF